MKRKLTVEERQVRALRRIAEALERLVLNTVTEDKNGYVCTIAQALCDIADRT